MFWEQKKSLSGVNLTGTFLYAYVEEEDRLTLNQLAGYNAAVAGLYADKIHTVA
jgi:hypothetical protein